MFRNEVVLNKNFNTKGKNKIFIINPEPSIREAIDLVLSREGYRSDGCDGTDAMRNIKKFEPTIVILEAHELTTLPLASEIVPKLKRNKIKVLLISTSAEIKKIAQKLEIDSFLQMPFDVNNFLSKIEYLLNE